MNIFLANHEWLVVLLGLVLLLVDLWLPAGAKAKLGYVARLRKGEHEDRDDVVSVRGTSVKVSGGEFWLSADGEISGPERSRSWRLERAAYSMILP